MTGQPDNDEEAAVPDRPEQQPDECICTDWCSESYADNPCAYCRELDIYEPCPVVGFGCGFGATLQSGPCDCCTPEQWAAAIGEVLR